MFVFVCPYVRVSVALVYLSVLSAAIDVVWYHVALPCRRRCWTCVRLLFLSALTVSRQHSVSAAELLLFLFIIHCKHAVYTNDMIYFITLHVIVI